MQQILQLILTFFDIKRLLSASKTQNPANTRLCVKTPNNHKIVK